MSVIRSNTPVASPAGPHTLFYNYVDYYSTSEDRAQTIHEETHMCYLKVTNPQTRYTFTINPTPDANDIFSDKLVNEATGTNPPFGGDSNVFIHPQVWVIVANTEAPLLITGFSADRKQAFADVMFLSGGVGPTFENFTTTIYNCRFVRKALSPTFYGTWAGGVGKDCDGKYSAILKAKFIPNYLGVLPKITYLRMQKQTCEGGWIDYIPNVIGGYNKTPLKYDAINEFGYVEFVVTGLEASSKYSAFIADVTNNANLLTLLEKGDTSSIYFRKANQTVQQPIQPCIINTPQLPNSKKKIRFITGSCYNGTFKAYKGAELLEADFHYMNGDTYYQDSSITISPGATGDHLSEFVKHYDGNFRNDYLDRVLKSTTNFMASDDHEVGDNFGSKIVLTAGNTGEFQLNTDELALYNSVYNMSVNGVYVNRPYIIFPLTNQSPTLLVPNEQIMGAFKAFDMVWPARPYNADPIKKNWQLRWGEMDIISINSNPYIHNNGSIEYWYKRAIVSADGNINYINEPNQFIPGPGFEFLKQKLKESTAILKVVFFSKNIKYVWAPHRKEIMKKFIQMAKTANPNVSTDLVESTFNKLYRANMYDNADGYENQMNEFIKWVEKNKIKNVMFCTGDPHISNISIIGDKVPIISSCLSSVCTYRSSGYTSIFYGAPQDQDHLLMAVARNSYGDIEFDPVKQTVTITIRYGDVVRGTISFQLDKCYV